MSGQARIIRIHNRLHLGGPIYNVAYLTKYLPGDRYETRLLIGPPLPDETSAAFLLEAEGLNYEVLGNFRRRINPVRDIRAFIAIWKAIRQYRPHIVHTHTAKGGLLGRLAAWMQGVPVIVHTFHGHIFSGYFHPVVNRLLVLSERFLSRITHTVIAISDRQAYDLVERYRVVPPRKLAVVPLGLDLDRFAQADAGIRHAYRAAQHLGPDHMAVALIGRFAPIKNHRLMLEALALFRNKFPDAADRVVLFLVGDGDLRTSLQQQLRQAGIPYAEGRRSEAGEPVVFTSWIRDVAAMMPAWDLVALSSDNEGTPLSLIEAQAAGLPVLATDVGGVRDVMIPGETGLVVPAKSAAAMAEALYELVNDKSRRQAMGLRGRTLAQERFSYRRLVADVERIYASRLGLAGWPADVHWPRVNSPLKVSVITVARNSRDTIEHTARSVASQQYSHLEYLVVDGASTDGTSEILASLPGVHRWISEPDSGIYDAMNKGIDMATGDIIGFLNADDVYPSPEVIERVVQLFEHTGADAVYGDLVFVEPENGNRVVRYWKSGPYRYNSFLRGWMPAHPTFFMRRSLVEQYGHFRPELKLAGDYELMLRLIHQHHIRLAYLPQVLVQMRAGGLSNASWKNRWRAHREDYKAWRLNGLRPYFFTLPLKPIRKLPQWIIRQIRS